MPASQTAREQIQRIQRKRRRRAPDEAIQRRAAEPRAQGQRTAQAAQRETLLDLQQSHGNRHVQRLLNQQPAPGTQRRQTDFGNFVVWPDQRPLSPSLVPDPLKEWPLSNLVMDQFQRVIDIVGSGATEIEVKGSAAFKAGLLADLALLLKLSPGEQLLRTLAAAGKRLRIEYAQDSSGIQLSSEGDAGVQPDGKPGRGSEVLLRYKASPFVLTSPQAWEQRKPSPELAGLLIDALTALRGTGPASKGREPQASGAGATGPDPVALALANENMLRAAFGLPLRPEE